MVSQRALAIYNKLLHGQFHGLLTKRGCREAVDSRGGVIDGYVAPTRGVRPEPILLEEAMK